MMTLFSGPVPVQMILIAVFSAVIFVLLFIILLILFRKNCCDFGMLKAKKSPSDSTLSGKDNRNNLVKVNNLVDQVSGHNLSESEWSGDPESLSGGSGAASGPIPGATLPRTTCISNAGSSDLLDPEIPPKPDVIDTGYVPYGNTLRDYNPPLGPQHESPYGGIANPAMARGVLNVSDPRFSATYGNPYLRQGTNRLVPVTMAPPSSYSSSTVSSFHPTGSLQRNSLVVSTVPTNSHYSNNIVSTFTVNPKFYRAYFPSKNKVLKANNIFSIFFSLFCNFSGKPQLLTFFKQKKHVQNLNWFAKILISLQAFHSIVARGKCA